MRVPNRDSSGHEVGFESAFSSKEVDGKSLYKREHGVVVNCSVGTNVFSLTVSYAQCKMNELKLVWQPSGCTADFEVFDDNLGTYSGTPNLKLNQYGYGVGIAENNHHSTCRYDADLYLNMVVKCTITCPTGMTAQDICVNFILNEVK